MGSLNGIAHRIAVHERRWPAPAPEPEPEPEEPQCQGCGERYTPTRADSAYCESCEFWEQVRAVAPAPVWSYFVEIHAECAAEIRYPDTEFDPDAWLKRRHPAFDDVLEGLARAVQEGDVRRLTYVKGWMVRMACHRYAWSLAFERAAGKTAVWFDATVQERAAQDVLSWTKRDCDVAWLRPTRYVDQWRRAATRDVAVLERAGLRELEVELLLQEEED